MKLNSRALKQAQSRLSSLKSLGTDLDLGNGMTIVSFETQIDEFEQIQETYNTKKSELDGMRSQIRQRETALNDLRERMLLAIASKFGKDSHQYVLAGGVRKSERKRPTKSNSSPIDQMKAS